MTEQEKSLELARLMGWRVDKDGCSFLFDSGIQPVCPYDTGAYGLSQFAAILLANIKVMDDSGLGWQRTDEGGSQTNILDEILRINGVEA